MAVTLEALPKGHHFPATAFELSTDWVNEYAASVEDRATAALGDFVPPMALAALSIRALLESAALPAGTIHLGQEVAFLRAVRGGDKLRARAQIASRGERQGGVLMGVELTVDDESATPIMTGRATVTFPAQPSAAAPEVSAGRVDRPLPPALRDGLDPVVKTITQAKIDRYALSSGDNNPLHTDTAFAATTRFGGTIAHGMLLLAYISEMLTLAFGQAWLSSGRLKVRFRGAARPGDTLTVEGRIVSSNGGTTVCEIECRNQKGEILITGVAEVGA
jgi:3-hydroxybutyryl-CoA dehydratase